MNFHTDEWIMNKVREHYNDALLQYPEHRIVGVFYQGSGNYGMDYEDSDVDTKCVIVPTINQLVEEQKASHTHIRDNDEHIDFKDIRIMLETFRKCNLNFLEILYTKYCIINPIYADEWNRLIETRDKIVSMNPVSLLRSMKGIAGEKYHAMEHRYPSKVDIIDKYGYDGKQSSHLLRIEDYIERYIAGENYESCLHPTESKIQRIMNYKLLDKIPLADARVEAIKVKDHVTQIADAFCETCEDEESAEMRNLLESVQYNIMKIAIEKEFEI